MDIRDYITPETVQEFKDAGPRMGAAFSCLEAESERNAQLDKVVETLNDGQLMGYILWLSGKAGV